MLSTEPRASARSRPAAASSPSVCTSWNLTEELPQLSTSTFTGSLWHGVRCGPESAVVRCATKDPRRIVDPTFSSLVASAERGDPKAADALFTALYSELHRMARR